MSARVVLLGDRKSTLRNKSQHICLDSEPLPSLPNRGGTMCPVGENAPPIAERSKMTSKTSILTGSGRETFPDFPPRDDMQNWLYLYDTSIVTALALHLADFPEAVVASEVPVGPTVSNRNDVRIPDLLVALQCNRGLLEEQRGYSIESQGGAPDLVLEVASPTTGRNDYTDKRLKYEGYGVTEYWRFDPSGGTYYDAALAGDRLVEGRYSPIEIEHLAEGRWRGYSDTLRLYVCWEERFLKFYDPEAESYLRSHQEAEDRVAELEEELRRLRGE